MKKENQKLIYNRNFLLLYLGKTISKFGDSIYTIALLWYILDSTSSGSTTGLIMFLYVLPGILIKPFGGIIADRVNRKRIIILADFFSGILMLSLYFLLSNDNLSFLYLSLITICISLLGSLFDSSVEAILPGIVIQKNLQKANSFDQLSNGIIQITGYMLGEF